jgi:hypothetical protein
MYALPGEQWQMRSIMELKLSGTWSREHEREEGWLLGYAEWQNQAWLRGVHPG